MWKEGGGGRWYVANQRVQTSVVQLSHFRSILRISIKYFLIFKEEGYIYIFKYEIYYTIWLHIILLLLKVVGYEYVNFQFSKNDKCAQRLCRSIF